jgi:hypothetical protein
MFQEVQFLRGIVESSFRDSITVFLSGQAVPGRA